MAWLTVDENGDEYIFEYPPVKDKNKWVAKDFWDAVIKLREGSIEKLIGKKLTWNDEPYELLSESEELERMERN